MDGEISTVLGKIIVISCNLEAEGVKDDLIDGGDVEVEHSELLDLQAGDEPQQLLWPPLGSYLYVGVALHDCHLYVCHFILL